MALAPTDVASIEETTAIRLVTAHRRGNREAFDEIVRAHYSSLLATARHRLGNLEDAKDAVQETLLRALLALDRFGDTGDWRLGAWLNTILFHVCADIPARRKRTAPLTDWLIESHPDDTQEWTSDYVALAAVQRAIDELPESQRRAFELRLVDGRSYGEVARALDITEVNARARVRRARAALQHALEDAGAVKGAWAGLPLLLTAPIRAVLRRTFAGAGDAARTAGSQAITSGAATTGSSTVSAIAGTPVQTGIQLITQVSSTPLGQAVVASATGAPGKGSLVLGIVASLAAAGGLSAPAAISGSTAQTTTAAQVPVASAITSVTSSKAPASAATSLPPATSAGPTPTVAPPSATVTSSSVLAKHSASPTWLTLATGAGIYGVSSTGAGSPGEGSASSSSTATTPGGGSTSAAATGGTTSSQPSASAPAGQTAAVTLPFGTCSGVTGFPGVRGPTSVPGLTSSGLDGFMSTGPLDLASGSGSPAFSGTALVKPTSAPAAPVHLKVGTCLAVGGSILAVDMSGATGNEVQLVGSLVSKPFSTATGSDAYLFRGSVAQLAGTMGPGNALPWGLAQAFIAEVTVNQATGKATLAVVFLNPQDPVSAGTGTSSLQTQSVTMPPTRPAGGSATSPATTR